MAQQIVQFRRIHILTFTAGIFSVGITYCFEHKIFTTHKWIHYTLHTMKYHYYAGPLTCTAQISRVWTPPTSSAHSSHSPLWNQILATAVEYFCTLNCVGIVLQRSTLWGNWCTTVNWRNDQTLHWCWNRYTTHMYLALLCSQLVFVPEFKECIAMHWKQYMHQVRSGDKTSSHQAKTNISDA